MTNWKTTYLILYGLLLFLSMPYHANSTNSIILSDSLRVEINSKTCDSLKMPELFSLIKKNRKTLKGAYIPLLHTYTSKAKKLNYQKGLMQGYDRIGLQYRFDDLFDSAVYYHLLSLHIAIGCNDFKQQYYNYNNLGQVYRIQDLNGEAIPYYHKALDISDQLGDKKSSSYTMNSLGAAYLVQKEPEKAMFYFQKSARIAEERKDTRTLGHNYSSMGQLFLASGALDSAMHYLQLANKILINAHWRGSLAITQNFLGQVFFGMDSLPQAEKYFRNALPQHIHAKNVRYQSIAYVFLGKIKLRQHDFDSANFYLKKGKQLALTIHSFQNLQRIAQAQFEMYEQIKDWPKAITALQQVGAYHDSVINSENARVLQNLEVAYQSKQKEQKIKLLSAENKIKSQRIRLTMILIALLIIGISLIFYMQIQRKKQSIYQQDKLKQQLMLSQMNPHFIYNALGSIQSFMYRNEGKKAAAYLGNFASLSRSILNNSSEDKISLEEEVKTLRNYLELENMRMQHKFEYQFNYENEVDAEFIQIPPMMLQPFVENSIKHGFKTLDKNGSLQVCFEDMSTLLKVEIIDNGVGIGKASMQQNNHQSKATDIFNQRMHLLKSQFPNIPPMQITDLLDHNEQGTKVIIYLPIFNA